MPQPTSHLSEWTLEQMAEGLLPEPDQRSAAAHVEACARCAAELEGYRALFTALSGLPRFAPSPGFSDAVLARIQIAPQPGPVLAWMRRWMPQTTRGWVLLGGALLVPALPVVALLVWLFSQPMVSATSLGQWVLLRGQELAQAAWSGLLEWGMTTGAVASARSVLVALQGVPMDALVAALALLAVAIPLSAWSLVRLVRTPMGNATYAN